MGEGSGGVFFERAYVSLDQAKQKYNTYTRRRNPETQLELKLCIKTPKQNKQKNLEKSASTPSHPSPSLSMPSNRRRQTISWTSPIARSFAGHRNELLQAAAPSSLWNVGRGDAPNPSNSRSHFAGGEACHRIFPSSSLQAAEPAAPGNTKKAIREGPGQRRTPAHS